MSNWSRFPTADETNDNIVAFWAPESCPKPGQPLQFDYRMHLTTNEAALQDPKLARVLQTMRSAGEIKGADMIRQARWHPRLPDGLQVSRNRQTRPIRPVPVSLSFSANGNADVVENSIRRNPVTNGWRVTLRIKVKDPAKAVEMRAALVNGQNAVSETWSYQLPSNSVSPAEAP